LSTAFTIDSEASNTKVDIPLSALQSVNWYRLKLSGTGDMTIHSIEKNVRVERDTNG
jgi:hypothetical protein